MDSIPAHFSIIVFISSALNKPQKHPYAHQSESQRNEPHPKMSDFSRTKPHQWVARQWLYPDEFQKASCDVEDRAAYQGSQTERIPTALHSKKQCPSRAFPQTRCVHRPSDHIWHTCQPWRFARKCWTESRIWGRGHRWFGSSCDGNVWHMLLRRRERLSCWAWRHFASSGGREQVRFGHGPDWQGVWSWSSTWKGLRNGWCMESHHNNGLPFLIPIEI